MAAVVLLVASSVQAVRLKAGAGYLLDNTVYSRYSVWLGADRISSGRAELAFTIRGIWGRADSTFEGTRAYDDPWVVAGGALRYSGRTLLTGFDIHGGLSDRRRWLAGVGVPLRVTLPANSALLGDIRYSYGNQGQSPLFAELGGTSHKASADVGYEVRGWQMHASVEGTWMSGLERDDYERYLADTAFFNTFYDIVNPALGYVDAQTDPLAPQRILGCAAYVFGPVRPWCYLGASWKYRDASGDSYLLLADTGRAGAAGVITGYFPYTTPHRQHSWNLAAAVAGNWERGPLSSLSCKLEFPVYSTARYHGYYFRQPGNLLMGVSDFYYDYHGTGAMTLTLEARKSLRALEIAVSYRWDSSPYVAYHFFGDDAYQYHAWDMVCSVLRQTPHRVAR